jgi:hypothetical protein
METSKIMAEQAEKTFAVQSVTAQMEKVAIDEKKEEKSKETK